MVCYAFNCPSQMQFPRRQRYNERLVQTKHPGIYHQEHKVGFIKEVSFTAYLSGWPDSLETPRTLRQRISICRGEAGKWKEFFLISAHSAEIKKYSSLRPLRLCGENNLLSAPFKNN